MPASIPPLSRRILARLCAAEAEELNPWLRDDLRIARLTVAYAAHDEAVLCSPDVLASYMILGIHPIKVWPAIQARRIALVGPVCDVPKKPPQAVKLWTEKIIGARAASSRAGEALLREPTISVLMAAPSIAALYPNSNASSSAKTRAYTYEQWLDIVRHSFVRAAVRRATLNALTARGPWPGKDGPATGVVCVAFDAMSLGDWIGDGICSRRTAQRRAKLACNLKYWRLVHKFNRWLDCPKCGTQRTTAICPNANCKHRGRSRNRDGSTNTKEFCRPYTFEIDLEKFLTAEPPKHIRHFCARTWKEHKEAAKRGEHPNLKEWPRKPAQPSPEPPREPAPARRDEPLRKTAEHQRTVVNTLITSDSTKAAQRVFEYCGLADISLIPKIAIGIIAEAKFQGIEMEAATKYIAESALDYQRNGGTLNAFYWRDLKWRSNGKGQQTSAAAGRAERSQQSLTSAWHKFKDAESERTGTGQADSLDPDQLKE